MTKTRSGNLYNTLPGETVIHTDYPAAYGLINHVMRIYASESTRRIYRDEKRTIVTNPRGLVLIYQLSNGHSQMNCMFEGSNDGYVGNENQWRFTREGRWSTVYWQSGNNRIQSFSPQFLENCYWLFNVACKVLAIITLFGVGVRNCVLLIVAHVLACFGWLVRGDQYL
jgi:hypothetical protein